MIRFATALAAAFAFALTPSGAAAKPAAKAAAKTDWSHVVKATPEGGMRMGNPAAPVKLVEYGSLACPHCRHFEQTGYKPLVENYVRSGKVSYEFRNLLLNAPDISVSLLAHCAGPAKFFPMSQAVFDAQPQWQDKLANLSDAQKAAIDQMTDGQRIVRFAELAGFVPMAARFGVTPARARQCLTDTKGIDRLVNVTKAANDAGVDHTPTFLINGKIVDGATWDQLEPQLKKALGG